MYDMNNMGMQNVNAGFGMDMGYGAAQGLGMDMNYGATQGFGMDMGYGMQIPRINKAQVVMYLQDYVVNNTGIAISETIKLDEDTNYLRHACAQSKEGVSILQPFDFCLPMYNIYFKFFFCYACGRLYYPRDFM